MSASSDVPTTMTIGASVTSAASSSAVRAAPPRATNAACAARPVDEHDCRRDGSLAHTTMRRRQRVVVLRKGVPYSLRVGDVVWLLKDKYPFKLE